MSTSVDSTMLLPLLCLLLLSTQLGVTLLVKSVLLLLLGEPSNITEIHGNFTEIEHQSNNSNLPLQLIPGTYDLDSSSNFENYLKEMGVSYFLRQLAMLAQPQVTFSINCGEMEVLLEPADCEWTIFTDAGIKTHQIVFTLGKEVCKGKGRAKSWPWSCCRWRTSPWMAGR